MPDEDTSLLDSRVLPNYSAKGFTRTKYDDIYDKHGRYFSNHDKDFPHGHFDDDNEYGESRELHDSAINRAVEQRRTAHSLGLSPQELSVRQVNSGNAPRVGNYRASGYTGIRKAKGGEDEELEKDLKGNGEAYDPKSIKGVKGKVKDSDDEDDDDSDDDDEDDDDSDDDDEEEEDMEKSVQDAVGDEVGVHIVDTDVLEGIISKAVQVGLAGELKKAFASMKDEITTDLAKSIGEDLKVLRSRTANTTKAVQQIETAQEEILSRVDTLVKSFGDNADLVKGISTLKDAEVKPEIKAEAHDKSADATSDSPSAQADNIAVLTKAFSLYQRGVEVKGFDPTCLNAVQRGDFTGIDFSAISKGLSEMDAA